MFELLSDLLFYGYDGVVYLLWFFYP